MKTRVSAALDGVWLHEIDPSIIVQRVEQMAPSMERTASSTAALNGQLLGTFERKSVEIKISFSIKLVRDYENRAKVFDKVRAWAMKGGRLETTYRAGAVPLFMDVVCDQLPELGNVKDWSSEYTATFRAYAVPYWQSKNAVTWTYPGATNTTAYINNEGTAKTIVDAQVRNTSSSTIKTLSIKVGTTTLAFDGLGLGKGETLVIDYDDRRIQSIYIISTDGTKRNAAQHRTLTSSDDLIAVAGKNKIVLKAGSPATFRLSAHARWI